MANSSAERVIYYFKFRHDRLQFGAVLRSLVVFSVPEWGGVVSAVVVSCNQLLLINS